MSARPVPASVVEDLRLRVEAVAPHLVDTAAPPNDPLRRYARVTRVHIHGILRAAAAAGDAEAGRLGRYARDGNQLHQLVTQQPAPDCSACEPLLMIMFGLGTGIGRDMYSFFPCCTQRRGSAVALKKNKKEIRRDAPRLALQLACSANDEWRAPPCGRHRATDEPLRAPLRPGVRRHPRRTGGRLWAHFPTVPPLCCRSRVPRTHSGPQ